MISSAIIVIPCYNEMRRLDISAFKRFVLKGHPQRFLFVDDGSTDETWHVLEGPHEDDPQHFILRHLPRNVGKGEAVRQGLLQAFDAAPDYVGYWDADLARWACLATGR